MVAEESSGKGKMQIKTNLIHGEDDGSLRLYETELDRVFPELFHDETKTKFDTVQADKKSSIKAIQRQIFTNEFNGPSLYDVKDMLFTEDYTSSLSYEDEEEVESFDIVSTVLFYGSVAIFISIIVVVVFLLGRKLT